MVMEDNQNELSKALKAKARLLGFDPIGIARIPGSKRIDLRTAALERWLKKGNQADMKWMEANRRKNIATLLEGATSLVAVGLNYHVKAKKSKTAVSIARYGWGKDYHKVIEQRLKKIGRWLENIKPDCKWTICVDSAPLLDKAWAEEAGLGWIGKNSNLINPTTGSWIAIGHLLCTEPLTPDQPSQPLCGECRRCIDQCPTQAITEPFVIDSRKCIAYHTIENRNLKIPDEIGAKIGTWIAGCDICQEVCPWNKQNLPFNEDPEMQPADWLLNLTKEQALKWKDEEWKEKLRGSALRRIKPWMWRRNAQTIQNTNHKL